MYTIFPDPSRGCQLLMVRRHRIFPLSSFHRLQFRIVILTLSVLSEQAFIFPMHQMDFILSNVDTMSTALVCFLHRLPIDLFFMLLHRPEMDYINLWAM